MKTTIILFFAILVLGCKHESQSVVKNGAFEVELLFEHDGCKVYRFYDGKTVYYSDCRGRIEYDYTTHTGKTTIHHKLQSLNN